MRWFYKLSMQVQMLFRRKEAGVHLDHELQFHIDQQIAENIAAGMSLEEARHAAMRCFGNPTALRDEARSTWSWSWLESLLRNIRIGSRTLVRTPGFALIAILVMALGIGANVALFTIVRSVLLKPLPFRDPDRLVRIYEHSPDDRSPYNSSAAGVFAEWKKQSTSFSDMALWGNADYNLSGKGGQLPEQIKANTFSWNMLPVLGVQPALGRNFLASDDRVSANATVLLSWGLWKRRFGGNPSILNQTILLDAKPYTVIGIMPAWFQYPSQSTQLWTPLYHEEDDYEMHALGNHNFRAIGRLKPGITQTQAASELTLITRRIRSQNPDNPYISNGALIRSLLESIVGNAKRPLYVLLAATGCLLLIACLNVANLLVARSAARRKEIAIRAALGGSRLRLLGEHLTESFLLSLAGGSLGFLLAYAALQWFISTRADIARAGTIHIDGMVMAFACGLIFLCSAFAGLISVFANGDKQALTALQESSRTHSAGHARARFRKILLSVEVGLTVVLLIGAGLMMKSYAKLRSTDLGCITENVLTMRFSLPEARYTEALARVNFFETLLSRIQHLPGVRSAAFVSTLPGEEYGGDNGFKIPEHPPLPPGQGIYAIHRWTDPGYFASIGIPILRGRTFGNDQRPDHATEMVISNAFAQQYFPGEDPIGKHIDTFSNSRYEIVGIVGDSRFSVSEPPRPMMYFPLFGSAHNSTALVIRSDQNVMQQALPIQKIVQQLDGDLPVIDIRTMDQVLDRNTLDASFNATLLLGFAILSLILAAAGLFGVLSYIVAQRTTEIGIRIALGAQRRQVMRLMLSDGLAPALFGLFVGLLGSAAVTRLIQTMLYGTSPLDPLVFVSVSAVLFLVAALACILPAWNASHLDPMCALRME